MTQQKNCEIKFYMIEKDFNVFQLIEAEIKDFEESDNNAIRQFL